MECRISGMKIGEVANLVQSLSKIINPTCKKNVYSLILPVWNTVFEINIYFHLAFAGTEVPHLEKTTVGELSPLSQQDGIFLKKTG